MQAKICPQCKKEFVPNSSRTKYCSKDCASKSMMHRKKIICPTCGKEALVRYSHTFCSRQCADTARRGVRRSTEIIKVCPVCNKSFVAQRQCSKFCSRECANIGMYRPSTHVLSATGRKKQIERTKRMWEQPGFKEAVIDRMKQNNPMYMPGVVEKAKETRLKNGSYPNNFKYGNGKISKYEQIVYDRLLSCGFYYNYPIITKIARDAFPQEHYAYCYKADFVNLKDKLCVEIDGYGHSSTKDKEIDAKKERCLQYLGFKIIRFTHKEIDEGKFDVWLNLYQNDI